MRRLLLLGAILLGLGGTAQAAAKVPVTIIRTTTVTDLRQHVQAPAVRHDATPAEQSLALRIAYSYWQTHAPAGFATSAGMPFCGPALVSWRPYGFDASDEGAEAFMDGSCQIIFNPRAWTWWRESPPRPHVASGSDEWQMFCTVTVHEVGHLILGPDFFAATDPADPAHSAVPGDVMYSQLSGLEVSACVRSHDPSMS